MASDPALQAFLQQQRAEYRASLPARLARLEAAWAACHQDPAATAASHELERCAHAIAGSAATFGLPELGDAARAVEEACEQADPALPARVEALQNLLIQGIASGD